MSDFLKQTVLIGSVPMGGENPLRIQSMTNTNTLDTEASVEQCIRIADAGADYVRLTAQGVKEAENLRLIKDKLRARGYDIPLIADIHFNPKAAETAAAIVEKVRINPGNYTDRSKNIDFTLSDEEYMQELHRTHNKLKPLLVICKKHHTVIRIGVNHGSLAGRIMNRYGDTPEGMVASAMEFIEICESEHFHDLVISMKSSNTRVMVQATRLLMKHMQEAGRVYPLHLGVTEAGEGEDGRIKSAIGIGTLLAEGIGDTIRVSLTEDPEAEIPVADAIRTFFSKNKPKNTDVPAVENYDPFSYKRRETININGIGGDQVPVVTGDLSGNKTISDKDFQRMGFIRKANGTWKKQTQAADFIYLGSHLPNAEMPGDSKYIIDAGHWKNSEFPGEVYPLFKYEEYFNSSKRSAVLNFLETEAHALDDKKINQIKVEKNAVLIVNAEGTLEGYHELREIFFRLLTLNCKAPVIIRQVYQEDDNTLFQLHAACAVGGLFLDGFGDGLWLKNNYSQHTVTTAFGILQAARTRITSTEYISCPSCGRTHFNLQQATAAIRTKTAHLVGLKIGIMGCIVNGPGEMADADYGYVGAGPGKITLYKGKEVIKKNIPEEQAVDELIELIKIYGDWTEAEAL